MWKVDCSKLINEIGFTALPFNLWIEWERGRRPNAKRIVELEIEFNIDFKDYIIVKREPKTPKERLRFLREVNGFTLEEFSDEIGIGLSAVQRMEKQDELTEDRIFELNEFFGCQTTFLKKGGEPYADKKIFS